MTMKYYLQANEQAKEYNGAIHGRQRVYLQSVSNAEKSMCCHWNRGIAPECPGFDSSQLCFRAMFLLFYDILPLGDPTEWWIKGYIPAGVTDIITRLRGANLTTSRQQDENSARRYKTHKFNQAHNTPDPVIFGQSICVPELSTIEILRNRENGDEIIWLTTVHQKCPFRVVDVPTNRVAIYWIVVQVAV